MNADAIDVYAVKQRRNAYERDARKRACVDVEKLAAEVARLRERIEDLEDAKKLDAAIARNAEKPLIPWGQARIELS